MTSYGHESDRMKQFNDHARRRSDAISGYTVLTVYHALQKLEGGQNKI